MFETALQVEHMDGGRTRVLLIEDNPADAGLVEAFLAEAPGVLIDLQWVDRLASGLQRCAAGGLDAVLLDLSLPDSQGLDTVAALRAHSSRVPIVVLTGLEDEALALRAMQAGAQDYLVKGQVASATLVRSLRYAMERKRAEETLRAREQVFLALHEVAAAIGGVLDPAALAQLVVKRARDLLGADAAGLFAWDAEAGLLRRLAESGLPTEKMVAVSGKGMVGRAFQHSTPVVVVDYPAWEHATEWGVAHSVRSGAAVPLLVRDHPLGALVVYARAPRAFDTEQVQFLALLAAQVGPALEAARLHAESERRRAEAEALAELARQGAAEPDAERVIGLICEQACRLLGADFAGVVLSDREGRTTWPGIWGNRTDAWRASQVPIGKGPAGRALATGRTVIAERLGENAEFPLAALPLLRGEGGRTTLATPLVSRQDAPGVLLLGWRTDVTVAAAQVRLAEALAGYAATILDNARAHARAQQLAREAGARAAELAAVLEQMPSGVIVLDAQGHVTLMNQVGRDIAGGPTDTSRTFRELAARYELREPITGRLLAPEHLEVDRLLAGEALPAREYAVRRPGQAGDVWIQGSAVPLRDAEGQLTGAVAVFSDITARKLMEQALEHQALHDTLTDLPNRILLQDRLYQAVLAARRDNTSLALLLMDVDRLHEINDTLGHHVGDVVLQQVGQRLRATLRASDTVARLGGDEFAALLPGTSAEGGVLAAGKLLHALEQPWVVEGHRLDVEASMGLALYPEHGETAETLLRRAEVALYVAKRAGNGYTIYTPEQDQHSTSRLGLVGALRQAIEGGQLTLHYQPKVGLKSGRVVGVEALVRWQHPERGLVPPDQFIPLAEQTGLIKPLTRWVLTTALRQCQAWQRAGLELTVAVNLSMRDLHDPQLPDTIAELLAVSGVPPARLELELTESVVMADPARATESLRRLCAMGVRIAIDDFGTGYSSLGYLQRLPVGQLKVDRSFVRDMATNESDAAIVRATIELGHALDLEVVAEGVEDMATRDLLVALGCDLAQGYYLSRPLPAAELERWLKESPVGSAV